jgi:hypothetical protein
MNLQTGWEMFVKVGLWFISVVAFFMVGCKSRDFNSDIRGKIEPSATRSQSCHETLSPKAPYTPEVLLQQLTLAMNQAASSRTFESENFRDLLFSSEVEGASKGALKSDSLQGDTCSLVRDINASMTKPTHFYWLTGNGRTSFGGMALYKGDVFAEGFYRNRSSGVQGALFSRKAYGPEELFLKQPWFEWNSQSKKFIAKLGNPSERILSHVVREQGGTSLMLHRGTTVKFAEKTSALATLNSFPFGASLGGIFSTPSFEDAKGWASPVVLSSRLELNQLSGSTLPVQSGNEKIPALYAGIEFNYVEVAFLYAPRDKNNLFFDNVVAKCVVSDKAQGNESSFAPPCK